MKRLAAIAATLAFSCSKTPPPSASEPVASVAPHASAGAKAEPPVAEAKAGAETTPSAEASANAEARASADATPSASASVGERMMPGQAPCRALKVKGDARISGGGAIATLGPLDGKTWVELGAGAELSVKHGATTREFALMGPGRFLPCRLGLEQVVMSEGRFESSPGSGVRPGAEMWVATPLGAVRYADAAADVRVVGSQLSARVTSGRIHVEVATDSKTVSLNPKEERRWTVAVTPPKSAAACESAARAAKESASQLLGATGEALGKLSAAQLEARRRARASCLAAEAALEQVRDPAEKARLSDQVSRANQLWQGIPAMLR